MIYANYKREILYERNYYMSEYMLTLYNERRIRVSYTPSI